MRNFKLLEEIIEYIKQDKNTANYRWNNDSGDWDIEDIRLAAPQYNEQYECYCVDVDTYDIYDENYKGGECLFSRIEDVA